MKSILDKTFNYTPAAQTDLRKTFARVRRELKAAGQAPVSAPVIDTSPAPAAPIKLADRRKP